MSGGVSNRGRIHFWHREFWTRRYIVALVLAGVAGAISGLILAVIGV